MKTSEHPLFPPINEDDDPPEVEFVHVSRFENGKQPWCAHKFAAEELTDLEEVALLFGGGQYELIARSGARITARRRYDIAGRPRPLVFGAVEGAELERAPAAVQSVAVPQAADAGVLGLVVTMMQSSAESNRMMMQMMMKASSDNLTAITAMMTAMASRDADGSKTLVQAIQANSERAIQGQAQVFQAMLEATGKRGGNGKEVLEVYKEGLADAAGTNDEGEDDGLGSTIANVVEGLKFASQISNVEAPAVEAAE